MVDVINSLINKEYFNFFIAILLCVFGFIKIYIALKSYLKTNKTIKIQTELLAQRANELEFILTPVIKTSTTGCAFINTDGLIRPNQAFANIVQWPLKELKNKSWSSVFKKSFFIEDLDFLEDLIKGNITVYNTLREFETKDGKKNTVELSVVLLHSVNGVPDKFFVTIKKPEVKLNNLTVYSKNKNENVFTFQARTNA